MRNLRHLNAVAEAVHDLSGATEIRTGAQLKEIFRENPTAITSLISFIISRLGNVLDAHSLEKHAGELPEMTFDQFCEKVDNCEVIRNEVWEEDEITV